MAVRDWFAGLLNKRREVSYARMLSGLMPVFSQFGRDIYASDLVHMSVDAIATETSKLQPRHIRVDDEGKQTIPRSSLNRLFKHGWNPLMTTRDGLEKSVWLLYRNHNLFIYPMYQVVTDSRGFKSRYYTGFYPLDPTMVTFKADADGVLWVDMTFSSGDTVSMPYADVIHVRKQFSRSELMGGGPDGQPDNQALLKTLAVNDTVLQGLDQAVRTTLSVRGILKMTTLANNEEQKAERARFEQLMIEGKSGILPADIKSEYLDLKPNPTIIDKDTLTFIQDRILNWHGMPIAFLAGTFKDDEYEAFYERALEPLLISFGQAFSRVVFSQRELDMGNEVVFYRRDMMYLSTASKLKLIEIAGAQGLLTDDQKLGILGYPPLEDGSGSRRTISLNYVSTEIADQYQMTRARGGLRLQPEPDQGGSGQSGADDKNKGD